MALATRCPHCGTVFRVANDQLKLRSGLVRCGACKEIFNGVEQLVSAEAPPVLPDQRGLPLPSAEANAAVAAPVSDPAVTPAAPAMAESSQKMPEKIAEKTAENVEADAKPAASENNPGRSESQSPGIAVASWAEQYNAGIDSSSPSAKPLSDPLQRMTLMDFAHPDALAGAGPRPDPTIGSDADDAFLDSAIDELTKKPYRRVRSRKFAFLKKDIARSDEEPDFDEPDFVRAERRKMHAGMAERLALPMLFGLLLITLIFQLAYIYRHQLSASMPDAKDALVSFCGWIGCTVQLPAVIESVVIDSSELQLAPNSKTFLTLSMTLHNKSAAAQAWPSIELTLNDTNEQAMVRRVFSPAEYVASNSQIEQGIPARSAPSFKLNFELLRPRAAGYKVYLFYP